MTTTTSVHSSLFRDYNANPSLGADLEQAIASALEQVGTVAGLAADAAAAQAAIDGFLAAPLTNGSVIAANTLVPRTLAAHFGDRLNVKMWGATADGVSRPLSGVTSFNGSNTTGWTLAQWQAVFPTAQSLADTLDVCAVEAAFYSTVAANTVGAGPAVRLYFPKGVYVFNRAASLIATSGNTAALRIEGESQHNTQFAPAQSAGVFVIGSTSHPCLSLAVDGISMAPVSTYADGTIGIDAVLHPTFRQNATLRDIKVFPKSSFSQQFATAIRLARPLLTVFENLDIAGASPVAGVGQVAGTIGLQLVGYLSAGIGVAVERFKDCSFVGCDHAVDIQIPGGGAGDVEGIRFTNCDFGGNYGVYIKNLNTADGGVTFTWRPPQLAFSACNFDCYADSLYVEGYQIITITDCCFLQEGTYASAFPTRRHINLQGCIQFSITACNFAQPSPASGLTNILLNNCADGFLSLNRFLDGDVGISLTGSTQGVYIPSNTNIFGSAQRATTVGTKLSDTSSGPNATPNLSALVSFGGGGAVVQNGNGLLGYFRGPAGASANYADFLAAASGSAPTISGQGSDTNVGLTVTAKGTGALALGTSGTSAGPVITNGASCDGSLVTAVPTTGFTNTIPNNCTTYLMAPAGTLASGTVNMPAAPFDKQRVVIASSQTITSFTVSGNGKSLPNSPTTLSAGTSVEYLYFNATSTWYRLR